MEKNWEKIVKMFGDRLMFDDKHMQFNEKSQALSQISYALRTLGHRPKVLWASQVGVPKLGFLSQNFCHFYFSQIKFSFWQMRRQYLIVLKKIFPTMYSMSHQTSFDLYFPRTCGRESNSQFDSCPFFLS